MRSLGSSLIAKSKSGSKLRDVVEQNVDNPALPGKGQIGTISRTQVEEPLERPVPQGSEKIVAVQPTVEGAQVAPENILPDGVGLPDAANVPLRSGAGNQPLLSGAPSSRPSAAPSQAPGRVNPGGATVSNRGVVTPTAARAYQPEPVYDFGESGFTSSNQQVQGSRQNQNASSSRATTSNTVGTSPILSVGGSILGGLRSLASGASKALPALSRLSLPTALVGNMIADQRNKQAQGQSYAKALTQPSQPVKNTVLRSSNQSPISNAIGKAKNVANNVGNFLRSLTGGKKR